MKCTGYNRSHYCSYARYSHWPRSAILLYVNDVLFVASSNSILDFAPENVEAFKTSLEGDIYAVGVLLFNLIYNYAPEFMGNILLCYFLYFNTLPKKGGFMNYFKTWHKGLRPSFPEIELPFGVNSPLQALICACWAQEPNKRPTANAALANLKKIMQPFKAEV